MVSCALASVPGATTSSNMPVEEIHDTFATVPVSAETSGGVGEKPVSADCWLLIRRVRDSRSACVVPASDGRRRAVRADAQ